MTLEEEFRKEKNIKYTDFNQIIYQDKLISKEKYLELYTDWLEKKICRIQRLIYDVLVYLGGNHET